MDKTELAEVMLSLRAYFPDANFPPETVEAYSAALRDLPAWAVREAVARHIAMGRRWMPAISEIARPVGELVLQLPDEYAAWSEAQGRSLGRWEGEKTPLVTEAIKEFGGAWEIRTSSNIAWTRSEFIKMYAALRERALASYLLPSRPSLEGGRRDLQVPDM